MKPDARGQSGALSAFRLAAYAAPMVPLAALNFPVFVYLAPFYVTDRGLPLGAIAFALVTIRILDALTDPLMGYVSDRWRTRFGRRKPWLVIGAPIVALGSWIAFVPPPQTDLAYVVGALLLLTLSWTVALVPYLAWGGEVAADYAGRARITAWRESGTLIGTLVAAGLYAAAGGGGAGLRWVALFVVTLLPIAALVCVFTVPEPRDYSHKRLRWAEGWAALRANAPFLRLLIAYIANGMSNALPATLFLFFVVHVLKADDAQAALLLAIYFIAAVVSMPLWAWSSRRLAKHRVWGIAMIYACAVFAIVPFLGAGDFLAFAIVCVLTGIAFGADIGLPPAIQADVVDVDTAASGEQRTGLYFALWSVATKASSAIGAGIGLFLLQSAGFDATSRANPPQALLALSLLYALVPIALKLVAVAVMWRFPLDHAAQRALRDQIEARRAL